MRFYASEQLGPKQSMTPEGFLVCHDVPIARTGQMLYGDHEVPIEPGGDGLIRIERVADEVFRAETLASFQGKPVTLDHPDEFVGPSNWSVLAKGVTQNVRRGTGIEDDFVFADLLITDQRAIEVVRSGLREVSCGYEADYEQVEPGRGVQRNIVGNHVALVERGRCGPRCSIGDKETTMTTKTKRTFLDRILTAFKAQDQAALDEAIAEGKKALDGGDNDDDDEGKGKTGDAGTAKALDAILKRLNAMDADIKAIKAKDEESEEEKAAREAKEKESKDAILEAEKAEANKNAGAEVYTGDAWSDVIARAEMIAPGLQIPTRDSKTKWTDAICACQRQALTTAMATDAGKAALGPLLADRDVKAMTVDELRAVFIGASEIMRARNNAGGSGAHVKASTKDFGKATTPADLNAANRAFWADRNAK